MWRVSKYQCRPELEPLLTILNAILVYILNAKLDFILAFDRATKSAVELRVVQDYLVVLKKNVEIRIFRIATVAVMDFPCIAFLNRLTIFSHLLINLWWGPVPWKTRRSG